MEASVNAVNIEEGTQRIGRCRLTSIYLEDLRTGYTRNANASRSTNKKRSPIPTVSWPTHTQKEQEQVDKPKRKRSKDYVNVDAPVQDNSLLWQEFWDFDHQCSFYYNKETQVSQWEKPSESFIPDLTKPKSPSQIMDLALAKTKDKKAFRAAKREAENFIGLLLRVCQVDLPDPENLMTKLDDAVKKLHLTLQDSNSDGETVQSTAQRKTTDSKNNPKFGAEESSLVSAIEEKESEKIEVEDKAQDVVKSEVENRQAKDWDTLHARSTGLMSHIPEHTGNHIHFSDDQETGGKNSQIIDQNHFESQIQESTMHEDSKIQKEEIVKGPLSEDDNLNMRTAQDPLDLEGTEKVISLETPEESLPLEMASNIAENPQTISEVLDEKLSEESQIPNGEVSERILAQGYSAIPGSDNDSSDKGLNFNEALVLNSYEMLKQVQVHKYWTRRYSLWSRFDDEIQMDLEGWYSATPEKIASHQAKRLKCGIAIDAFGGVGGNAIQLASTCSQVLVSDSNMGRLLLAKHNASVYGVAHKMDFICGDFLKMAPHFQADAVFLSPPWGGPSYHPTSGFSYDISSDIGGLGIGYKELISIADSALYSPVLGFPNIKRRNLLGVSVSSHKNEETEVNGNKGVNSVGENGTENSESSRNGLEQSGTKTDKVLNNESKGKFDTQEGRNVVRIATFLPKTTNLNQVETLTPGISDIEVERNFLDNHLKSITVYHGLCARL